jgi:hypothetical protein
MTFIECYLSADGSPDAAGRPVAESVPPTSDLDRVRWSTVMALIFGCRVERKRSGYKESPDLLLPAIDDAL